METTHSAQAGFWRNATSDVCFLQVSLSKVPISPGRERQMNKHNLLCVLQAVLLTLPPQRTWDTLGVLTFKLKIFHCYRGEVRGQQWVLRLSLDLILVVYLSKRGKKAFLRVNTLKIARSIVRCSGNWSVVSVGQNPIPGKSTCQRKSIYLKRKPNQNHEENRIRVEKILVCHFPDLIKRTSQFNTPLKWYYYLLIKQTEREGKASTIKCFYIYKLLLYLYFLKGCKSSKKNLLNYIFFCWHKWKECLNPCNLYYFFKFIFLFRDPLKS